MTLKRGFSESMNIDAAKHHLQVRFEKNTGCSFITGIFDYILWTFKGNVYQGNFFKRFNFDNFVAVVIVVTVGKIK